MKLNYVPRKLSVRIYNHQKYKQVIDILFYIINHPQQL